MSTLLISSSITCFLSDGEDNALEPWSTLSAFLITLQWVALASFCFSSLNEDGIMMDGIVFTSLTPLKKKTDLHTVGLCTFLSTVVNLQVVDVGNFGRCAL